MDDSCRVAYDKTDILRKSLSIVGDEAEFYTIVSFIREYLTLDDRSSTITDSIVVAKIPLRLSHTSASRTRSSSIEDHSHLSNSRIDLDARYITDIDSIYEKDDLTKTRFYFYCF